MRPELPREVLIATNCSAALDEGDTKAARTLAEEGLALATATGNATWIRRFQHLLRAATGTPIKGLPPERPLCSFCLRKAHHVTAGPKAFICDECVRRCSSQDFSGSSIKRLIGDDMICSFCARRSAEPLFVAPGYSICSRCVEVCTEMGAE
jgi:ClpX C4-type zinc finger